MKLVGILTSNGDFFDKKGEVFTDGDISITKEDLMELVYGASELRFNVLYKGKDISLLLKGLTEDNFLLTKEWDDNNI